MNEYLKQFLLPAFCAAVLLVLGSCKENPPVQQPPDSTKYEDTTKPAPTGMPDWNDSQYDWIRTRDSLCGLRDITKDYWTPKFSFIVMDASPDGKRILLSLPEGVAIYDTSSHTMQAVFPFSCESAAWSHDGRYVAGVSYYPAIQQRIAVYDAATHYWTFVSLPDSVNDIVPTSTWLPGDTAIVIGIFPRGATRSYSYVLGVVPPHLISFLPDPHFGAFAGPIGFSIDGPTNMTRLRVGPLGILDSMKVYPLSSGISRSAGFSRVSPDGNWLAFRMDADMTGSRFNTTASVTSLGIIDLRPGSPTQYQLYRVFPDYTNTYRNCSAAWFFSGVAWSGDGKYVYHEQVRISDSTTQIVRRNVRTGKEEAITNFLAPP